MAIATCITSWSQHIAAGADLPPRRVVHLLRVRKLPADLHALLAVAANLEVEDTDLLPAVPARSPPGFRARRC